MAFQGGGGGGGCNAFALLAKSGDGDGDSLFAGISTATVKVEVPLSAADKRNGNNKKESSFQSSSRSLDHEKLSYMKGIDRQDKNNKLSVESPGTNPSNGRQDNRRPAFKSHNGYMQGGKQEKAANGESNAHGLKEEKATEEEEGWQIIVRSKVYKQSNSNPSRNGNVRSKVYKQSYSNPSRNGNLAWKRNGKVLEGNAVEKVKSNGDGSSHCVQVTAENGNLSDSKELIHEAIGFQGDETCPKQDEEMDISKVLSKDKTEPKKLTELDAKKMTLKQYEKLLEEKRKVLETMKTEERKVALDTDFSSMHVIAKKNEEEPYFVKMTKKGLNNKDGNNSSSLKAKKIVLSQPPTAGRGGSRNSGRVEGSRNQSNAPRSGGNAVPPPPSVEDTQQFPALLLDGK